MNNQEITSSPPNYSWLLLGLTALVCACLLSCCQTKKKALNIQKSETTEQSDVKKETADTVTDKSQTYYSRQENISGDYSEVIEESADSTRTDKQGTTIVYNPKRKETRTGKKQSEKKSEAKEQKDVKLVSTAKVDSSGKSSSKDKSKVQGKEVKDQNTLLKSIGFIVLFLIFAWAIWRVYKQVKPKIIP